MTTPAAVLVDRDDHTLPIYEAMWLPLGWSLEVGEPGPLSVIYNRWFDAHSNEPFYGFLADDVVPETPEFDRVLIETAGTDGMAVPAGGETTGGTPHFVIAGALAREQGWLSLPGLHRIFIDTVWAEIARSRGVLRHRPDVTLAHHHFSNGKALFDSTYRKPENRHDRVTYATWKDAR